jgi:hypothetical protein
MDTFETVYPLAPLVPLAANIEKLKYLMGIVKLNGKMLVARE